VWTATLDHPGDSLLTADAVTPTPEPFPYLLPAFTLPYLFVVTDVIMLLVDLRGKAPFMGQSREERSGNGCRRRLNHGGQS